MKKLIAMLGAVAMSFGLFADTSVVTYSTSFEAADSTEVSGTTFTPGDNWTWGGEAFTLKAYVGDAYDYTRSGEARRTNVFAGGVDQDNYLPLSTSGEELKLKVENIVLDQLVKFTGFEDDPDFSTTDKTKIAVWMKGLDADEGTGGETNLYVTCAKVTGTAVEPITLKLVEPNGDDWSTEKWYRLTIKNIGDIYEAETPSDAHRAGFIVYIDGKQVAAEGNEAKGLIAYDTELTGNAAGYMANGQLFPAYDITDVAFNAVAYKGIGDIDDIVIDNLGPQFAQVVYNTFTVGLIDGLTGATVSVGGKTLDPIDAQGTYKVQQGTEVTITWVKDPTYKIMSGELTKTRTVSENGEIKPTDDDIVVAEIFATKVNGGVKVDDYAETELYGMITTLANGDVVTFAKNATISDGTDDLYGVTEDTAITVAIDGGATSWTVNVAEGTTFTDNVGVEAGNSKTFLGTTEDNALALGAVTIAGELKADAIELAEGSIQLAGDGSVVTKNGDFTEEEIVPADDKELHVSDPVDDWYTYTSVDPEPEPWEATVGAPVNATVTVVSNGVGGATAVLDYAESYTLPAGDTLTVTYEEADGYTFSGATAVFTLTEEDPTCECPPATAIEYAITVADAAGSANPSKYTVEGATVALTWTPVTGKKFVKWTVSPETGCEINGNTLTIAKGTTGAITVTANTTDLIDLSAAEITLSATEVFEGDTMPTFVKAMLNEDELTINKDFTLTTPAAEIEEGTVLTWTITGTGDYMGTASKSITVKAKAADPDPTKDDPEDIPADKTATEYFPNVSPEIANTGILAKDLAIWCQGNGKGDGTAISEGGANIKLDAYKLDCANTDAAVLAAKENFKFTAADLATVMAGETPTTLNKQSINGTLVITKWADPAFKVPYTDGDACFYKAEVTVPPAKVGE